MAEMKRFELLNGFHHYTLSKRAPSTTRTHLRSSGTNLLSQTHLLPQTNSSGGMLIAFL